MQKPQPNHRVILNAIRELRQEKLPMQTSNDLARGDAIIQGMAALIKRMEITEAHREILREWEHLRREMRCTYDRGVHAAVEAQIK